MKPSLMLVVALVAAGCGGSGGPPEYPTLEPDRVDPVTTDDVPEAPHPDPAAFTGPPSNPTGGPVAITWQPVAVGDRQLRTIAHDSLYSSDWADGKRRQRTVRSFRVEERVASVDQGAITAIEANVLQADETVRLDDHSYPQSLASGEYLITMTASGSIAVSRAGTGFPIGDREREELQGLYGTLLGRDAPLITLMHSHPLRVGEAVELTDDEKKLVAGDGEPMALPIHFWLASLDGGVATFHFAFYNATTTGEGAARNDVARGVEFTFGVEVATGRLRTTAIIDASADSSATMRSTSRLTETTTYE